ncbi:hypothetical protein [Spiroplasma tabanidicola]|uniref:Transmembrane protein n=1 Tax=Spiroplasma tabanidicola TaxID=324079 RepID=A0A6I6CA38_9MOLU|nr:hypothetical protein [Spiroplasma tabanidicola]QGS52416.1 hypothetical protein STABA_v1c10680 [Spiroplasma tabanidicola]
MFLLLIILAWSSVMVGATFLMAFGVLSLLIKMWSSSAFMQNLFNFFSNQPFGLNFFKSGKSAVSLQNVAAGSITQTTIIIIAAVMIIIAVFLYVIAIVELVRAKKRQKISKPYVKAVLVLLPVLGLLYGQVITLLLSGTLILAWILLEAVLFDSEALNNYAEERNLISIYKEERKFEREVNKEGKFTGNADSVVQNKLKKVLDLTEKANTIDNSALPNSSSLETTQKVELSEEINKEEKVNNSSKAYLVWKSKKDQLETLRIDLTSKSDKLNENVKTKFANKFNSKVLKLNCLASHLNLPDEYKVKYLTFDEEKSVETISENLNIENELSEVVNTNFQTSSIDEATSAFGGDSSTAIDYDIEDMHERYSGGNKPGIPQDFVIPETSVKRTQLSRQNYENQLKQFMAYAINLDFNDLKVSGENANASKVEVYNDKNFVEKNLLKEVAQKKQHQEEVIAKKAQELGTMPGTISAPPSFTNVGFEDTNSDTNDNNFVIPKIKGNERVIESKENYKKNLDQYVKNAVNEDLNELPSASYDSVDLIKDVYSDKNFKVENKLLEVAQKKQHQEEVIAKKAQELGTMPGTISAPPSFTNVGFEDTNSDTNDNNFVIPKIKGNERVIESKENYKKNLDQYVKNAVNEDLNELPSASYDSVDLIKDVYSDKNFKVENKLLEVAQKKQHQEEVIAKKAQELGTMPGTISAPPSFINAGFEDTDENQEMPNRFVAPQTKVLKNDEAESIRQYKESLNRYKQNAVNIHFSDLREGDSLSISLLSQILKDKNFKFENKLLEVAQKKQHQEEVIAKKAQELGTMPGTISAPPSFINAGFVDIDENQEMPNSFIAPKADSIKEEIIEQNSTNSMPPVQKLEEEHIVPSMPTVQELEEEHIVPSIPTVQEINVTANTFEASENSSLLHKSIETPSVSNASNSVLDEKIVSELEKRMERLESAISSLNNDKAMNALKDQFEQITKQLDKISNDVGSMKNTSPKSIIDILTKRHTYNQNNG